MLSVVDPVRCMNGFGDWLEIMDFEAQKS